MSGWMRLKGAMVQMPLRLCQFTAVCVIVIGVLVASKGVTMAAPGATVEPKPRWIFTTKAHFSWYALLTGAPVYRDQIRGVLLDRDHLYLGIVGTDVQFFALDRRRGNVMWKNRLSLDGYPVRDMLVLAGGRLVAGVYDDRAKELVIIGMDPTNGKVIWRVSLPRAKGPTLVGSEAVLDADHTSGTVIISVLGDKQWRRVVLRAVDGAKIAEAHYPGYVWRKGPRWAAGMILGYEGLPSGLAWDKYRRLLAFHESTGKLAWSFPLLPEGASPPTVLEDSLLIANGAQLLRIDLRTGRLRWNASLPGRSMDEWDPPLVMDSKIAVVHAATPDPEDRRWNLSIFRFEDGAKEAEVAFTLGDRDFPNALRRMGNLAIVSSSLELKVIDIQRARIAATLDFEKLFSRFVYAEPSMRIAGSDAQGFVAVTTDGILRYFSAEDFPGSAQSSGR